MYTFAPGAHSNTAVAPDTGPQPGRAKTAAPRRGTIGHSPPEPKKVIPVAYRTSSTIPRDALARLLEQTPELPISWNAALTQPVDAVVTGAGSVEVAGSPLGPRPELPNGAVVTTSCTGARTGTLSSAPSRPSPYPGPLPRGGCLGPAQLAALGPPPAVQRLELTEPSPSSWSPRSVSSPASGPNREPRQRFGQAVECVTALESLSALLAISPLFRLSNLTGYLCRP